MKKIEENIAGTEEIKIFINDDLKEEDDFFNSKDENPITQEGNLIEIKAEEIEEYDPELEVKTLINR